MYGSLTFLQDGPRRALQAIEGRRGDSPDGRQVHLGRREDVRDSAGRRREAEEAAAVAGAAALASVAVDGGLELARGAKALTLALVGVQILHVPAKRDTNAKWLEFKYIQGARLIMCALALQ